MRISGLSSGADINKLKQLLDAGVITQDDLNQANVSGSFGPPQNALASMANPQPSAYGIQDSQRGIGDQFGTLDHELYTRESTDRLSPEELMMKDALAAQQGDPDALSRVQNALKQGVTADKYGELPKGNNFVKNETTGLVTYLTPQGLSDKPAYGATIQSQQAPRSIPIMGMGGGPAMNMGTEPVPDKLNLDKNTPLQLVGGQMAYYSKDEPGAAYVLDANGNPKAKVYVGYNNQQLMALQKQKLDQQKEQGEIAQGQASIAHTNEMIRASKINNPDVVSSGQSGRPLNMNVTGNDFLSQLDPMVAQEVKAIGDGKTPFNPRSQRQMNLLGLVQQYNPDWSATDYQGKQATTKDFATGGKSGQVVQAINQALHHAATVSDAIDSLNNTNVAPGIINPIVNTVQQKIMGDTRQGNFSTAAMALSEELKKIYAGGGGGSLAELQSWQKSFDPNAGQQQQKSYLAQGMNLLQGAIESRQEAYKRGMGPTADFGKLFSPQALEALQKLEGKGYISSGGLPAQSSQAPAQQAPSIPPQAVAFLKANPAARYDFDRKYGQGMADKVLGR